jgi:hypothetical protein
MLKRTLAVMLCVLACAGIEAGHAQDQFVFPAGDGRTGLCEPFECSTRIQQVMDGSLFPAKMRIEALVLYNTVPHEEGFIEPAHYRFFLSETDVSAATITTDFDANVGRNNRQVIDWTVVSGEPSFFSGGLTLPLSKPFVYDPRRSNLLIEIIKDRSARFGDGPIYVDGNVDVDGVTLVSDHFGIRSRTGMTVGFVGKFLVETGQ